MSKIEYGMLPDEELENVSGGMSTSLGGNSLAFILDPGEDPAEVLATVKLVPGTFLDNESLEMLRGPIAEEMTQGGYTRLFAHVTLDYPLYHIDSYSFL